MGKLYPPYLEGTIPAFCDTKEGTVLTVPFSMNRAVSKREVAGFYLKLKTIQSDKYLITLKSDKYNLDTQEIYFDLSNIKDKLNIGQFYKIQIAYVSSDATSTIGYYSSVGIVKYTSRPNVYIEGLEKNTPNRHSYNYLGCYSQESSGENDIKDYTEKVYSYRFTIEDKRGSIIADSDWTLHNNSKDINSYESQDEFLYMADFEINKNYYIKYHVRTNNGLEVSSPKYKIVSRKSIYPDVDTKPVPILNFDNGFVEVHLDPTNYISENNIETVVSGSFVLSRKTGNEVWKEVLRFSLIGEKLSQWHWNDFTVEQGKTYMYSIQEYNDYDLYSERIESDEIYVDFEDAFLFDGKRQLRIRFNPKISSFKTNHLENKIDTIGSKHPFIFRNGKVEYKEFPISGLISYQMDDSNLFGFEEDFILTEKFAREKTNAEQLDEYKVKTTNLVGYNFSAERDFKLEVLDWLNNGKPKLFRSPSEGNYIVRLLNISLSPEDTINRLIHTFSSTAYEVAEYNYENLNKYGFISISEPDQLYTRWMTIQLKDKYAAINNTLAPYIELMQHKQATSVYFYDMQPGDMVYINGKSIIIGATGTYFIDNGEIIESIGIPYRVVYTGQVTYSFEDSSKNTFDTIIDVKMDDVVAHQFIGCYENILNNIEDIRTKVSNFYYLDFHKRDTIKAYAKWVGGNDGYEKEDGIICLYRDKNYTSRIGDIPENLHIDLFEDPFKVYQYDVTELILETSHGLMVSKGFSYVDLTEEHFILSQKYLKDRYYIKKEDGEYEVATIYNPLEKYYMKKPYELYYDPKHPMNVFVSGDTKKRLEQFEKDKLEYFGDSSGFEVQSYFDIYGNKCYIDGEEIDLIDDEHFKINSLTQFKEIKLMDGVVLNCGYELQLLEYFNEFELEDYYLIKDFQKILNTKWKDTKEAFYLDLLKSTGLIDTVEALQKEAEENYGELINLSTAIRKYYFQTIMKAHDLYEDLCLKYNNELTKKLIEQEVEIK